MRRILAAAMLLGAAAAHAQPMAVQPVMDDRIYVHGELDEFEARLAGRAAAFRYDGFGWIGNDTDRLLVSAEGTTTPGGSRDGRTELLYDRALTTWFDGTIGVRADLDSGDTRTWLAVGVRGTAPYGIELDGELYASDGGHEAMHAELSRDVRLTQQLVLQPQIELDFYSRNDHARALEAGLAGIDAGLRLRYEITPAVAPYLGAVSEEGRGRLVTGLRASF